jgi:anti-sigma regulatory factor (Ser/Thr protein kinase)
MPCSEQRVDLIAPTRIQGPGDIAFLCPAARARKTLSIDLSPVTWISPLGVVALLSTCLRAADRKLRTVKVMLPLEPQVAQYVREIGFVAELMNNGWIGDPGTTGDAIAPIAPRVQVMPLTSEMDVQLAADRLDGALSAAHIAPNLFAPLVTVMSELSGNAREHGSRSYLVAQTHKGQTSGTPGIHMAVGDFGLGFAHSLRKVCGKLTDSDALQRAFNDQVSGTGAPERGFGLGQIRDTIDGHRGAELHIVSRTARISRVNGVFGVGAGPDFKGTVASAYFPYTPAGPATR